MLTLLMIALLAALVGVARPYLGLSRKHFAGLSVAIFVMSIIAAPKSPNAGQRSAATETRKPAVESANSEPSAPVENAVSATPPPSKWTYSEKKDEMRGTVTRHASLVSENVVDLDFPYGQVSGHLDIRRNESGLNVMFLVDEGQILCHSFSDSYISVKFDDGPIKRMSCTSSTDGSSDTAFFEREGPILAGLKKAKRTVIEAEFYQKGRQQFIFDTAGLRWK